MNKNNAKDFLPMVQALADGKTIQFYTGSWVDLSSEDETSFALPLERYRIKPEPKLREWKPEEVPVGAQYRRKEWALNNACKYDRSLIMAVDFRKILYYSDSRILSDSLKQAFSEGEYSSDGGKSWHPCGILES